jgi:rhodanese-related sulfurtransferase
MHQGDVSPAEAYQRLMNNPAAVLIDVRTQPEWVFVGVPAVERLIRLSWQVYPSMQVNAGFVGEVEQLGLAKDTEILCICRSGARSAAAASALAQAGYGQPPEVAPDAPEPRPRRELSGGNDGLFIPTGPVGTLDYLPDIREGDITLLNTKAEVFAPFVRRVALRVFQNFWISLKKDLSAAPLTTQEEVEAEAVMDPRGEMIGFTVVSRSSRISLGSDRRLQQACNVGFFDRNPPPGARWDLASQTWVVRNVGAPLGTPDFEIFPGFPYLVYSPSADAIAWP